MPVLRRLSMSRGLLEQNLTVYPRHKHIKLVVEPVSGVQTGLHQFNGVQRTGTDSVPCFANGKRDARHSCYWPKGCHGFRGADINIVHRADCRLNLSD